MKFRTLGDTGLTVSELCLGTLQFGWKTDERRSAAILDAFWASGGTFIQASSSLVDEPDRALLGLAASETHVGRWLVSRSVPRAAVVLATRMILPASDGMADASRMEERLRLSCETSLRRFGTDYLDLLLCEWSPACLPIEHLVAALASLAKSGLVRHFGVSGFPAWRIMQMMGQGPVDSGMRVVAAQDDLSLVARAPFETDLAGLCQEQRLSFLARSPLGGGFLGGMTRSSWRPAHGPREAGRLADLGSMSVRAKLESIALTRDATAAQTALSWVLAQPTVAAAVIGVSSPEQLAGLVDAAPLSLEELAALNSAEPVVQAVAVRRSIKMDTNTPSPSFALKS